MTIDITSVRNSPPVGDSMCSDLSARCKTSKQEYTLQIILTNHCNLNCKYCYVKRGTIRTIDIETARKAIRDMVTNHPPKNWVYNLCFMGGEPLSEFEMIRDICEWTWTTYPDIDIQISSPTNGTILNEIMRGWLRKNRMRFSLSLSYDGDTLQNINRSNSASAIDTSFFRELWPNQPFKMTISEQDISTLAANMIALQEREHKVAANIACGEPLWQEESVQEFGKQMLLLAQYSADHPQMGLFDLIDIDLRQIFCYQDQMHRRCGIGCNYDTVDLDGNIYPCHLFSSLALSAEEVMQAKEYRMGERDDFTVNSCTECILNPICPRCYGMSFLRTGDPFSVDHNLCRLFKHQVKGACSYQIKRMSKTTELSPDDHLIICAIKTLLEKLHFE